MITRTPRRLFAGILAAVTIAAGLALPQAAQAAGELYTASGLTVTVAGTTATATVSVRKNSGSATLAYAGVCARRVGSTADVDFPGYAGVQLTTTPKVLGPKSRTFTAGTYSAFVCLQERGGNWPAVAGTATTTFTVGGGTTFTVGGGTTTTTTTSTTTTTAPPSGWSTVFRDDFTANAAKGTWPLGTTADSAVGGSWTGYDGFTSTDGMGTYSNRIVSQHDGVLDIHLQTINGKPTTAAPIPLVGDQWGGAASQRITVVFKADRLFDYKTAWLLWPDSGSWSDGEIDFPEGFLDATIEGYNHCPGNPASNCEAFQSAVGYGDGVWHTATAEWVAGSYVKFILDGTTVLLEDDPGQTPTKPMHYVMQNETWYDVPAATAQGHILVDSIQIDYRS